MQIAPANRRGAKRERERVHRRATVSVQHVRDEGGWKSLLLKRSLRREAEASEMFRRNVSFNGPRSRTIADPRRVACKIREDSRFLPLEYARVLWKLALASPSSNRNPLLSGVVPFVKQAQT